MKPIKNNIFTINCKAKDTVLLVTISEGRLVTSLDLFHAVDDKRVKTVKVVVNRRGASQ
jgi:hypothetical protein